MELLTFVIEGRGETHADDATIPYRSVSADSDGDDDSPQEPERSPERDPRERSSSREIYAAEMLNGHAYEMAQTIEREVRRLMPLGGGITVQADISFYPGSIILEGSVVLLYWAGRTALEPIRDELANAIKTVTRRVVNRAITAFNARMGGPPFLGQMTVEVTSVPPPPISTEALSPALPQAPPPQFAQSGILQDQRWLLGFVGILTVLVLILLADRLLTPSLPRNVYITPTAPPGTAPPK